MIKVISAYPIGNIFVEVIDESIDVLEAIKLVVKGFINTKEGRTIYEDNNNEFNWGDFIRFIPNSMCEKYGFKKINLEEIEANFYEELYDEGEDLK